MKILEGINEYLEWGRSIRLSRRWLKLTRYELEICMQWLNSHKIEDAQYVTEVHMIQYLIYLQKEHRAGKPLAVITVSHCYMSVRKYFEWLQRRGAILNNPCFRIKAPKWERYLPRVLNEAEMKKLVESPNTETAIGMRDRALMELLYGTGLRHMECWKLNIYDVDVTNRRLIVNQGKGGKDRIVPMTKQSSYWVGQYIGQARNEIARGGRKKPPTSALWVSQLGYRLSYGRLEEVIKGYARKLEIKITVHMFRHSYATHLLRGGADIRHIQELLGHSDIQSTTIYTHLEINDLKETVARLSRNE